MSLHALAQTLRDRADEIPTLNVVIGFDGFVDEMISVVSERTDLDQFTRVETISQFAELLAAAAGQSSLREIVVSRVDPGGCAINMGDGLATLGLPVQTFATVGEPMHPAFADYAGKASLTSWGREPGRTLAYEFADGKLMFSSVTQLAEFTPEDLARRLQDGTFARACSEARLIALTDWTLYPHMTACWRFLQEEVFRQLATPRFFLDLVDPSSRAEADIREMLDSLPGFEACGPTTLGLNQNEANILSRLTGVTALDQPDRDRAEQQARALQVALGITEIVIHAREYAVLARAGETAAADGPYTASPKKSTGAGDRFNSGYALGLLLELPAMDRLLLGVASSGSYVREGHSATRSALADFIDQWANGGIE